MGSDCCCWWTVVGVWLPDGCVSGFCKSQTSPWVFPSTRGTPNGIPEYAYCERCPKLHYELTFGQTSHSSSSPPSLQLKHSSSVYICTPLSHKRKCTEWYCTFFFCLLGSLSIMGSKRAALLRTLEPRCKVTSAYVHGIRHNLAWIR